MRRFWGFDDLDARLGEVVGLGLGPAPRPAGGVPEGRLRMLHGASRRPDGSSCAPYGARGTRSRSIQAATAWNPIRRTRPTTPHDSQSVFGPQV
jgi:hypothetical protein